MGAWKAYASTAAFAAVVCLPVCLIAMQTGGLDVMLDRRYIRLIIMGQLIASMISKKLVYGRLGSINVANATTSRLWSPPCKSIDLSTCCISHSHLGSQCILHHQVFVLRPWRHELQSLGHFCLTCRRKVSCSAQASTSPHVQPYDDLLRCFLLPCKWCPAILRRMHRVSTSGHQHRAKIHAYRSGSQATGCHSGRFSPTSVYGLSSVAARSARTT